MTKDKALRLALEALENMANIRDYQREKGYPLSDADKRMQEAITATKAALEAKDEPVGEVLNERGEVDYISYVPPVGTALYTTPPKQEAKDEPVPVAIVEVFGKDWRLDYMALPVGKHKLYAQQYTYTTPPQQEAKDEPVAWQYRDANDDGTWTAWNGCDKRLTESDWRKVRPLYTTPPQRKPLTDDEIVLIIADCASSHQHLDIHLARAIEQAHGIKGEA